MHVAARPALAADLDDLVAFVALAGEEIRESRGGAVWWATSGRGEPVRDGLVTSLDADDEIVVTGTIDDVATGYAAAVVTHRPGDGTVATISDLWVLPDARGVGVGEAMMDLVMRWAADRAADAIESSVLPGNREGKNFFERYGLVARAILVRRELSTGP